jgi:hypothetical protein
MALVRGEQERAELVPPTPSAPGPTTDAPPPTPRPRLALWAGLVGLLSAIGTTPAVYNGIFHPTRWTGPTDYLIHTNAALRIFPRWWEPAMPHFLLHLTARIITWVSRTNDIRFGMTFAVVATCVGFSIVVFLFFERALRPVRHGAWIAAALSLLVTFADSPSSLRGWSYQVPPNFYLPLRNENSPSSVSSHVLGLLLLLATVDLLRDPRGRWKRWILPLAVAATLMKPNLSPVIAGLALVWSWVHRRDHQGQERLRLVTWRLFLPVLALSLWQTWILMTQTPVVYPEVPKRAIAFAPFRDLVAIGGDQVLFWLVASFPIAVFILFGRSLLSPTVRFALAALAVLLALAFPLSIENEMWASDFWWTVHIGFLMVCVTTIERICELAVLDWARWRARVLIAGLVWVPYAVGGIGVWTCQGTGVCLVH